MSALEHPAFVCAREGHIPFATFKSSVRGSTACVTCQRCGKWIDVPVQAVAEEAAKPSKETTSSDASP